MSQKSVLDVHSSNPYPSNVLSNFHANAFVFDGVPCASMEGLLQSLKTKNTALQREVCLLTGKAAKFFFARRIQNVRWKLTGRLYWKGKAILRDSDEYRRFLDRAYDALYTNPDFVRALIDSADSELVHTIGKSRTRSTILTEYEFISRLLRLRARAQSEQNQIRSE